MPRGCRVWPRGQNRTEETKSFELRRLHPESRGDILMATNPKCKKCKRHLSRKMEWNGRFSFTYSCPRCDGKAKTPESVAVQISGPVIGHCEICREPYEVKSSSNRRLRFCPEHKREHRDRQIRFARINKKRIATSVAVGGYGIGKSDEQAGGGQYKI